MENDLVQLIKKIQNRNSEDGFEVSNLQITSIDPKVEFVSISYNGEDLTKNYVQFATDLLGGKFGKEFIDEIILTFGETLKTDIEDFKDSYKAKPSSIKEVLPSVFIHTSMSKILMESMLCSLVHAGRLNLKFNTKVEKREELSSKQIIDLSKKYTSISEVSKKDQNLYRIIVRKGLKEIVAKNISKNLSKV
jgi:hypothetical protein